MGCKKSHKSCTSCKKKSPVKYVKADAPDGGDGSRDYPWNLLSQAEADPDWKTLVVLYSEGELDCGIQLLDGQRLIGEGPDGCTKSNVKPVITNTPEVDVQVLIENANSGEVTADINAGTSGFAVSVVQQGTSVIRLANSEPGNVTDINAGTSGFAVSVSH